MDLTINQSHEINVHLVSKDHTLDFISDELADYAKSTFDFSGNVNETFLHIGPNTENILLVGLGEISKINRDIYVKAAHHAAKTLESNKVSKASIDFHSYGEMNETTALQGVAEGLLQAAYTFENYKTEKSTTVLTEVSLISSIEDANYLVEEVKHVLEGVDFTRDLVNTPANDLYPESLAEKLSETFEGTQVDVEIFDKSDLENLGAHALLAVSQGSSKEPRMIVLKYLPLGDDQPVVSLVGKGVTYDSGGYAIKTAKGMATMMTDMAGAAAMIGTIQALEANKVQQNVVAVIGATENLISGEAFKNGDIINTLKGTTVEVLNTDAEGRLVLADILYYAATELDSKYIIDTATLTGAVIAALGTNMTGAFTNNEALLNKVLDASKLVGEEMWQLPITDEFREKMKGNNADLTNSVLSPAGAGSSTAAAFLENFVQDVPWVHLDIAGTSYAGSKGNKYLPKGASGIPVKTLYHFIKQLEE